jgi:enoyl-CoA hydratase/carnithine racemase
VGLVSRLVEPAALLPAAEQMAQRIADNGPLAIRVTKELAWRGLHEHPEDMLRFYAAVTALIHETEDAKEGPRAFSEKRTPQFKNR